MKNLKGTLLEGWFVPLADVGEPVRWSNELTNLQRNENNLQTITKNTLKSWNMKRNWNPKINMI
jgi:hypothetical protein